MQTLTISQIQRKLHLLQDFDIIEVIDKRKNITKGYFLSQKHKNIVEKLEKKSKKKDISAFVGVWRDKDLDIQALKKKAWG